MGHYRGRDARKRRRARRRKDGRMVERASERRRQRVERWMQAGGTFKAAGVSRPTVMRTATPFRATASYRIGTDAKVWINGEPLTVCGPIIETRVRT